MEHMNQTYAMELVLFKLKEGSDTQHFRQLASTLTEALQQHFPGFKGRMLLHTPDETEWTDIVYWADMETALSVLDQVYALPAFQAFAAMIDSQGITMKHLIPANI